MFSRFLLQSLEDLDASLRKLNSRLFVIRGQPTDVFPRLFKVRRQTNLKPRLLRSIDLCRITQRRGLFFRGL